MSPLDREDNVLFWPEYRAQDALQDLFFAADLRLADGTRDCCGSTFEFSMHSAVPKIEFERILAGSIATDLGTHVASLDDEAVGVWFENKGSYSVYARMTQRPVRSGDVLVALPGPDSLPRHPSDPTLIEIAAFSRTRLVLPLRKSSGGGTLDVEIFAPDVNSVGGAILKSVETSALAILAARLYAPGSDSARQATDGVFLTGAQRPEIVDASTFGWLKYAMRPVKIAVGPDLPGTTVTLALEAGATGEFDLYREDGSRFALPRTWTSADFSSHKLDVPLLVYGKAFGEAVLRLTYAKGDAVLSEQRLKLRIGPFPGAVGVAIPNVFPYFRVVRTVNLGTAPQVALDPYRHTERRGQRAAVYVVAHKTRAQWAADPTLNDVAGGPAITTITGPSIANNVVSLASGTPLAPGQYDIVYDFGNSATDPALFASDGRLDPGDLLDTSGGAPSIVVQPSLVSTGAAPYATADYEVASRISLVPAGYDGLQVPYEFRLRGRVIWPTSVASARPLVVFAHGNHTPLQVDEGAGVYIVDPDLTSDENYRGYTYLQEHLASRGYVTASVDLDETVGDSDIGYPPIDSFGIKLRAWLILKNIEALLADPSIAEGAIGGRIDASRIYLVGHSRGGEAVHMALQLLKDPAERPSGGTLVGIAADASGRTPVRGIISFAPTAEHVPVPTSVGGGLLPADVPFLLLYGSADGDVNGASAPRAMPFRHFDRAVGDRYVVRIHGANHNAFNTSWGYSDASETLAYPAGGPAPYRRFATLTKVSVAPVGAGLIREQQQRDAAKAYVAAFLAMVSEGEPGAEAYFLEPPARLRPLGVDPALAIHTQAGLMTGVVKAVLDDYEANPEISRSSSGQVVTAPLTGASEEMLYDSDLASESEPFNRFFQHTRGVLLSWSGEPREYIQALAPAEKDLRGARVLSFRIAQQPKHPNTITLGGTMTIRVELEDVDGGRSAVNVAALDTIPEIYPAVVRPVGETTSAAFKTFRIPVAAFAADGTAIDLGRITRIRLRLGDPGCSPQGRVALDDLEIER